MQVKRVRKVPDYHDPLDGSEKTKNRLPIKFKISANPVATIFDNAGKTPNANNDLVIQRSKMATIPTTKI